MCRVAVYLLITSTANAATFFGPTPYLSQADSPFNLSGLGSTFFLEDFEDGLINTPGLNLFDGDGGLTDAIVLPPGAFTDSVDGDDGVIDGSGRAGHSLLDAGGIIGRPVFVRAISFVFDPDELGILPTAFGFVWTDGPPSSAEVALFTWNAEGDSIDFVPMLVGGIGDGDLDGGTVEDRFFGIRRDDGIAAVQIVSLSEDSSLSFEIDHVQYGIFVPEPSTILLVSILITIIAAARKPVFRE